MSELRQCDNCRTTSPDVFPLIVYLRKEGGQPDPFSFMSQYDKSDFCSWRCVQEYATFRALEPS